MYISGVHEQNTQSSCAFHPTCCLSVPRIFLTPPHTQPPLLAYHTAKVGSACTPENSQPVKGDATHQAQRHTWLTPNGSPGLWHTRRDYRSAWAIRPCHQTICTVHTWSALPAGTPHEQEDTPPRRVAPDDERGNDLRFADAPWPGPAPPTDDTHYASPRRVVSTHMGR